MNKLISLVEARQRALDAAGKVHQKDGGSQNRVASLGWDEINMALETLRQEAGWDGYNSALLQGPRRSTEHAKTSRRKELQKLGMKVRSLNSWLARESLESEPRVHCMIVSRDLIVSAERAIVVLKNHLRAMGQVVGE